jgi:chromosome segregation ATPase
MNTTTGISSERPADNAATSINETPAPAGGVPQPSAESVRVLVTCPHCQARLSVKRIRLGDGIQCKQCDQKFLAAAASGNTPIPVFGGADSPAASESPAATLSSATPGSGPASSVLLDQISKLVATNGELEKQVRELLPLREERDSLAARLQSHEASLSTLEAGREAIAKQLSDRTAELTAAHTELCRLREQLERAEGDLVAIGRQRDETNQQLEACQNDVASLQADLARLNSEQKSSSETIERLTRTNHEAALAHEKFVAQSQTELEAERAKQRQLTEELVQFRASAAETDQAIQPATPEELEASRRHAEDLELGLAESERRNRLLTKSLRSMGIRVDAW